MNKQLLRLGTLCLLLAVAAVGRAAATLADRTEAVTLSWLLGEANGAPTIAVQGAANATAVLPTTCTVGGETLTVNLAIDATNGKFNNARGDQWAQVNSGTVLTVPSCKGATVKLTAYSDISATTIEGQNSYTPGKEISYTVGGKAETVDIVVLDGQYYSKVEVTLPVVATGGTLMEKSLIATNFQDWEKSSTASTVTTNFSGEQITFTYENTSVDPNATNDGKFNSADDPAYRGYIMCEKKEATVTTSVFRNITKVRYRHGATGSNRGWGLMMKAGDGDWETVNDVKVSSPVWVEKDINKDNVQLRWYNMNTSQNAYMFELEILGNVLVTANQVTLATAVSPEGAGKVVVKPYSTEYDEGSEVTLTAERHFGYRFRNWTDASGRELGTDETLTCRLDADTEVTAHFEAVSTYALTAVADGANDYMIELNPQPTVVDGKNMYEEGQVVELTATEYDQLVTFNNWADGTTAQTLLVTMDGDKEVTAAYSQADIIAGWDFYTPGNSGRKADYYAQDNDGAVLNLVNTETGAATSWNEKSYLGAGGYESFKGAAVNWTKGSANGDVGHCHWQTKVNAEAFSDIRVQFQMLYNYNAYQTYNVEWSTDGEAWTPAGSITMTATKTPARYDGLLPAACNNQRELYIRMIADKTSKVDGTASANDGNALAMFFLTGQPRLIDDGQAPVLVSAVPADKSAGASASGKIVLTFDERIQVAEGATAQLAVAGGSTAAWALEPTVSGKTVSFEYKGLDYSTDYTFTLAAGSVSDLTGNATAEALSLTFTTMSRPTVTKGLYDAVVGDVAELVEALKAAENRADKQQRFRIFLKRGTYKLPTGAMKHYRHTSSDGSTVYYEGDHPDPITYIAAANLSLIGEDRDQTVVTQDISNDASMLFQGQFGPAHIYEEIKNSAVLQLEKTATDTYLQDLTVRSGISDALGRNLAVYDKASKTVYKNTVLYGYQDTWTADNQQGLYYFEGGQVRGRTDYLCGKGDAYFNGVELRQLKGGYAAVPSTPAKVGWVFKGCTISAGENGVDGNYTLGRPWGKGTPIALFIDTRMNVVPSGIGWSEMSNGWPARFAEYNSMTKSGSAVDLSGRKKTFGDGYANNPVLTAAEALEAGDASRMFGDWEPALLTEQAPTPRNVRLTGTTLTWDDSQYVRCWAIVKDGRVTDFTTEPTYTVDEAGATWAVRAANDMGGLSEAARADDSVANGVTAVGAAAPAGEEAYSLQGVRVKQPRRGVFIVGGRKVVR